MDAPDRSSASCDLICVDLDGTLTTVDTLHEGFLRALRVDPMAAIVALVLLTQGRAALKRRLAEIAPPDPETLPLNAALIAYLEAERAAGRRLVLVSAADQSVVDAVARRLPLFDAAIGSDGALNLSGVRKLEAIRARYGDDFVYAGDAAADMPIWRSARGAILAGDGVRFEDRVAETTPIEARFPSPPSLRAWFRALRPHQWAKNALVFVPLALAGPLSSPADMLAAVAGFVALSALASAGYLINDLLDIDADRRHPTKRARPFAAGALSAASGAAAALLLVLAGMGVAAVTSPAFALVAAAYFTGTVAYSLALKRAPLLDVMTLAGLYTLRIIGGATLVTADYSYWIVTFSMFIFVSLALLKRYAELIDDRVEDAVLKSRGYDRRDLPIVMGFGIGSSVAAALLFVVYLVEERFPSNVYATPQLLWMVFPILLLWLMRMWRAASHGEVHEDPVIFALKDRASLALGALAAGFVIVAW